jgi:hypothetical protein
MESSPNFKIGDAMGREKSSPVKDKEISLHLAIIHF